MAIAEAGRAANPARDVETACTHCGLPVPRGLVRRGDAEHFCCSGCRTAYAIIRDHGLGQFYRLPERRGLPVRASGRSFEEFDHPAFRAQYVKRRGDGLAEMDLYLEGVHCASCVWLVERVPLMLPGVASAELNVPRSLVHVAWDDARLSLSGLARLLDTLGYRPHPFRGIRAEAVRRAEDRAMIARIGVAGAIAGNVMMLAAALYSGWFTGMERQYEQYFRWVSLVLTTPAMIWPARLFFRGAWSALRARSLHMDLPIALALAAGFARGAYNTVTDRGPIYFDGVAMLVFLLLVGRFLQQRAQRAAADSAELLYSMSPASARVVAEDGVLRDVPTEALLPGMICDVRSGETIPVDGTVLEGVSAVDLSLLTGESRPAEAAPGERVYAGTVNRGAALRVRVEETGEASRLGRILREVERGSQRRAPVVQTADRIAGGFVAAVLVLAVATFVLWLRLRPAAAVDNAIALLIVTCPCALALATPLAVTVAIGRAARGGILIKGGDALERLGRPGLMILDKTGTVTEGRTSLVSWSGDESLKPMVLALERHSSHPLAAGFAAAWPDVVAAETSDVAVTPGGGLEGTVGGRRIVIGSPRFVAARMSKQPAVVHGAVAGVAAVSFTPGAPGEPEASTETVASGKHEAPATLPGASAGAATVSSAPGAIGRPTAQVPGSEEAHATAGLTPVWVAADGLLVARAAFGDRVRSEAAAALAALRARGWRLELVSGDDAGVVADVGRRLGFSPAEARGGATPEDKLSAVEEAEASGAVVMVGDGVNDAAAIARASVGIGVRGGAEACLAAADVFLARPGLSPLVVLVRGAERTLGVIRRNIAFSLVYNLVGAGLAVTGVINPLIAAIMMPASSLTVVLASWLGRTFQAPRS